MPWSADSLHAGFSTGEPWLPIDPRHLDLAVDRQEADPSSMLNITRRLIALRKAHPALARGDMRLLDAAPGVLCFERALAGQRLLCVFNLGDGPADWTAPPGWRVIEAVNPGASPSGRLPPMAGLILAEPKGTGA
jgi:alpha-glucosidase